MAVYVVGLSSFEFFSTFTDPTLTGQQKANISTMNDVGGLIGSSLIGFLSDWTYGKRSPVTFVALMGACSIFYILTGIYVSIVYQTLMFSFFFQGMFTQGVSNTIASTCSADIGKSIDKSKNKKAVGTVTGIIDGCGSIGASVGQFIVGLTVPAFGWQYGYLFLIALIQTVTFIPLSKILYNEIGQIR